MNGVILVVDDSATVRKFVGASLQLKGFSVVLAANGMEALEKMPALNVDLIITDLNMPDMDGFEFIKSVQDTPVYRAIPIIILTSMTDDGNRRRGLELGAHTFLEKPFSVEKVQEEVSRLLALIPA